MKKLLQFLDDHLLRILLSFVLVFTVLYPKLPSVHILHTWVYIRLEDFAIALTVGVWFIQVLRRKARFPWPISFPFFLFFAGGFVTLVYSLIFVGPYIANFFPTVAVLSYFRRIEYMVLFFVAFSTIRSAKDLKMYLWFLCAAIFGAVLYGFGQRYYINLWATFPTFFQKYQFCFPSFQTGNEEFAKGVPLCLPSDARITSTFGGHYDLAAYLVVVLPILTTLAITAKKWALRIGLALLSLGGLILLILTASRVSYIAFLVGVVCALIYLRKRLFIILVILVSIILLFIFSGSTAKRFMETLRLTSVVTNSQGQIVGMTESNLPENLRNKISKNPVEVGNVVTQNLPAGSAFLTLGGQGATNSAVVQSSLNSKRARELNLDNGGIEISTISGNFLVHKALVYDISFTTRLQGEWPHAMQAFLRNPLLGSGFATITLAADNDYLRSLGESGLLGFLSFGLIFAMLGILLREVGPDVTDRNAKAYLYGLAGGVVGLFFNATLIDVFEASKVAENLWILLGIAAGILFVYAGKQKVPYLERLKSIVTSNLFNSMYLLIALFAVLGSSIGNFLVADDFTWLHWANSSTIMDLKNNFVNATGFFYRPLDKLVVFILNTVFALQPGGYHLFTLLIHYLITLSLYFFTFRLTKRKAIAVTASVLFLLMPIHGENLYWFATISTNLSTLFLFLSLYAFFAFREKKSVIVYLLSVIFFIGALFSYEMSVIFPLILLAMDTILLRVKWTGKTLLSYVPFVLSVPVYLLIRTHAHAVSGGGDYSYSLTHLIPNLLGNTVGYLFFFLFGGGMLPIYTALREGTRSSALLFGGIAGLLILGLIAYAFMNRKKVVNFAKNDEGNIILFGLVLAFISLLPFIDLGNISERYGYLGSTGIALSLAVVLYGLCVKAFHKRKQSPLLALTVVVVLISGFFVFQLKSEFKDWQRAGVITHRTLSRFRIDYETLPPGSTIYFVNVPVKKGLGWIFPYTSIKDGLWFVYRDDNQTIYQLSSVTDAIAMRDSAIAALPSTLPLPKGTPVPPKKFYIFQFNDNGDMTEVK